MACWLEYQVSPWEKEKCKLDVTVELSVARVTVTSLSLNPMWKLVVAGLPSGDTLAGGDGSMVPSPEVTDQVKLPFKRGADARFSIWVLPRLLV